MLIRLTYLLLLATFALGAYLVIALIRRTENPIPTYLGVENCAACHSATSIGRQYQAWRNTAHADAWNSLQTPAARDTMRARGVSIDACAACHTTVGGFSSSEHDRMMAPEGVGCERCHGAGSLYALHATMRDSVRFRATGGVAGSLSDCYTCHARTLPRREPTCPFQTTPFSADSGWRAIAHPLAAHTPLDSARMAPLPQIEEVKR